MLIQKVRKIGVLASKCRSYVWYLVFIFSFFWSSKNSHAQYTVTATKTYTSSGTFTITDLADISGYDPTSEIFAIANVDILIVGGGGGGGRGYGAGGGGGGQVRTENIDLNLGSTLNITIGPGGAGATLDNGLNGGNTVIILNSGSTSISYTASGGQSGKGGTSNSGYPGGNSASGNAGGAVVPGTGNNRKGGGGGGSGGSGTSGTGSGISSTGGNGGPGVYNSIGGGYFGAGGGGNGRNAGTGGSGIGGPASESGTGGGGAPNTGSGGGAGVSNGGNGSNGIVVVQITYRILPVEFLYFKTSYLSQNKSAFLEWSTAKEWENSHFEIERAINTVNEWETIGRVEGAGYSDTPIEYEYQDLNIPISGGNIFYRLKQVDNLGKYTYSKTKAIQVEKSANTSAWIVYPNPSSTGTEVSIQFNSIEQYQDEKISVSLINTLGIGESQTLSSPIEVAQVVSGWIRFKNAGLYVLDIRWGNNSQQIKLRRN